MNDWVQQLVWTSLGYAAIAVICILALIGLYAFVPSVRHRWLPLPRLRPGRWAGSEVFLTFCAFFGFRDLIISLLFGVGFFGVLIGPSPDAETAKTEFHDYLMRGANIASPLVLAVTLGIIFMFLFTRSGSRPHHYGLSWSRWPANLGVGLFAFVVTTPIVYGVFVLVTRFFPETDHSVARLGRQNIEIWEWALIVFQVVVAAPLLEEIVFRGILLGWLRRASLQGHLTVCTLAVFASVGLGGPKADQDGGVWAYLTPLFFSLCLVVGYGYIMLRMARRFGLNEEEIRAWRLLPTPIHSDLQSVEQRQSLRDHDEKRMRLWAEVNADLALLGSAILFAAVHSQNWPAPIPLMLLGLVFGWLARRTQSLIGPIVLHALFNLVGFIALYATVVNGPAANGNAQTTPVRPSLTASITTSVPASQLPLRK